MMVHTRPMLPGEDSARYYVSQGKQCRHIADDLRHAPVGVRMVNTLDSEEPNIRREDDSRLLDRPQCQN